MTSTNFQIGLSEGRNSSRVLRAPGGGHTDIFGLKEDNSVKQTPSKQRKPGQSSIGDILSEDKVSAEPEMNKTEGVPDENTKPASTVTKQDEVDKKDASANRQGRVPPGGFSTGFW